MCLRVQNTAGNPEKNDMRVNDYRINTELLFVSLCDHSAIVVTPYHEGITRKRRGTNIIQHSETSQNLESLTGSFESFLLKKNFEPAYARFREA